MKRFSEVYGDLIIQTGLGIMDKSASIGDVIGGYSGGNALQTEDGIFEMSNEGARQLFRLIGLDVKVIKEFNKHPELQVALAQAKLADSGKADETVIVRGVERTKNGGPMVQAFLTEDHLPVLNGHVLGALREALPETAMVHKANISDRKMMLRLVNENWYHDLGPGGRAYTAIVVDNDERGRGGLTVRTGVARVACFNYSLGHQPVFHHSSGFLHPQLLTENISTAIERLDEVSSEVANRMNKFHDVHIEDVQNMLDIMSGQMGLPKYVTNSASEWWEENGAVPTLFWVVQALAFGADALTKRKKVQWTRREEVEYQTLEMASVFAESGEMTFHECPKCHRPLDELDDGSVTAEYTVE